MCALSRVIPIYGVVKVKNVIFLTKNTSNPLLSYLKIVILRADYYQRALNGKGSESKNRPNEGCHFWPSGCQKKGKLVVTILNFFKK